MGDVRLRDIFDNMRPINVRDEHVILRTLKKYVDTEEASILAEALVIEEGRKTAFLVLLSRRPDGVVVRIYPGSNVNKTEGVKRMLAEIAKQLLDTFPTLTLGKTNLQGFFQTNA